MKWFYSKDGQQAGPVDDAEFARLVSLGQIRGDTLVWKEGMSQWQPYSTIAPSLAAPIPPLPGASAETQANSSTSAATRCSVCAQPVSPENSVLIGGKCVCSNCKPSYIQGLQEGMNTELAAGSMRYAGFWIRLGAFLIDYIILWVVFLPVNLIYGFSVGANMGANNPPNINNLEQFMALMGAQIAISLAHMAATVAYQTFFTYKYRATPGKMLCGLRVLRADGTPPSLGLSFGRALGHILSGLTCSIGYIIAAFDDQKRSLHDHICNTRVVYRD